MQTIIKLEHCKNVLVLVYTLKFGSPEKVLHFSRGTLKKYSSPALDAAPLAAFLHQVPLDQGLCYSVPLGTSLERRKFY